ncbi:DUF1232 domain-containing protein [Sphingomonas sp.]|uniref:YkvA family protein n=1 Tax=Sphingomonas sp. TaxID=28214 RepID=UPI001DB9ADA0|nr:DUF1232 domain-containing protein [Sphingomonas sp.]MBX9796921.1 DUF1232 domain-containing protein [Sphingomonas sp.]
MTASLVHRIRVEAHAVWLAARAPFTPLPARLVGLLVAAYALSPIDLIPDFVPVLGLLDDALLVPAGVWLFERMVGAERFAAFRAEAEAASATPVSRLGALIVIALWAAIAIAAWTTAVWLYD